jgi:hypothetical protein
VGEQDRLTLQIFKHQGAAPSDAGSDRKSGADPGQRDTAMVAQ